MPNRALETLITHGSGFGEHSRTIDRTVQIQSSRLFCRKKPFGQNVEGLSNCGDESCAVERAVQKHDFEDSTLCVVIGGKPLLPQCLRKFKNVRRQLGRFIVRAVQHVDLRFDRSETVPHLCVLAGKRLLVDVIGQRKDQEPSLT